MCFFFWNFSLTFRILVARSWVALLQTKQQDMPRDIYQPQFCSLRASKLHVPKKSKHPRYEDIPWRCMDYVCIYFQLFLYHKFGSIESLIKWQICEAKILVKLGDAKEKKELEDSDQSGSPPDSLQSPITTSLRDERMQHCRESRELRGEAFLLGFPSIVEWTLETRNAKDRNHQRQNTKQYETSWGAIKLRCLGRCLVSNRELSLQKLLQATSILLLSVCGYIIEFPIFFTQV